MNYQNGTVASRPAAPSTWWPTEPSDLVCPRCGSDWLHPEGEEHVCTYFGCGWRGNLRTPALTDPESLYGFTVFYLRESGDFNRRTCRQEEFEVWARSPYEALEVGRRVFFRRHPTAEVREVYDCRLSELPARPRARLLPLGLRAW